MINLNSVQETKLTTGGVIECILPLSEGLKAVHHRAIKSVRRRRDEKEYDPSI
jgi:hypothetical protein